MIHCLRRLYAGKYEEKPKLNYASITILSKVRRRFLGQKTS